eukprot:CAMPEP_0197176270 /NCGR_PEP_ID=MMETSP1423-20130617/2253_1 /TAXON_ID=476441 /ORGANISM="Pseudo-nitzschia heimii, Strain UNC1101" /LENGTH=420 /DNA_ID=CAMNT_0042625623 /DNA_START=195 /DNA_END=1457 /DNA_ORIENTATION=-
MAAAWLCRTSVALVSRELKGTSYRLSKISASKSSAVRSSTIIGSLETRLFSTSYDIEADAKSGISRMETLQTMLSSHGAPGSVGCSSPDDLEPVYLCPPDTDDETPELVANILGMTEHADLHPHLYPLAKSKSTGNYICALRRAYADDASDLYENSSKAPWPIVEAKVGGPGMRMIALNSEHLMRRIVCECDFDGERNELIDMYNEDLGKGMIQDQGLDQPFERGSVEKLGYGVDKFVLLRVGPFPDIYKALALGHAERGDESSSLIAAEAANGKISGFASTFLFYASLLNSFPNRSEETRDAARMCLRMPLPSIGLDMKAFRDVGIYGQIAEETDTDEEILAKLQIMYEKMNEHETEDPRSANSDMTPEQKAIEDANYLIDTVALTGAKWSEMRPKLAEIYKSVGRDDIAIFVNPTESL